MTRGALGQALGVVAVLAAGCASGPGASTPDDPVDEAMRPPRPTPNEPSVEAEIGALDLAAVEAISDAIRGGVGRCFESANAKLDLPVVHGDIEVAVRVKSDGSLRHVFAASSDIGHAGVEACILALHEGQSWPKPSGGEEGLARTRFGRDPEGRAPVAWSADDLGDKGGQLARALSGCARQAGTSGITLTMYVDPDGAVMAAGAAVADEQGLGAVDCAVTAAKRERFPSPGSYPAKVTLWAR
jgi:hypothetical protein